jgi:hypothetical protein
VVVGLKVDEWMHATYRAIELNSQVVSFDTPALYDPNVGSPRQLAGLLAACPRVLYLLKHAWLSARESKPQSKVGHIH